MSTDDPLKAAMDALFPPEVKEAQVRTAYAPCVIEQWAHKEAAAIREVKLTMDAWNTLSHLEAACRMLSIGAHFAAGINCARAREYTREIEDPIARGRARVLCDAVHDAGYVDSVRRAGDAVRARAEAKNGALGDG